MRRNRADAWTCIVAAALVGITMTAVVPRAAVAQATGADQELEALRSQLDGLKARDEENRRELERLRERDEENRKKIDKLSAALEVLMHEREQDRDAAASTPAGAGGSVVIAGPSAQPDQAAATSPEDALAAALREVETPGQAALSMPTQQQGILWGRQVGNAQLQLIDLSADILFAAGGSTVGDADLEILEGGGHDPRRNGFTLQGTEIGMSGAVDPYFRADIFINAFLEGIELEEAFLTTLSLPWQLQLEAGLFLTEFGVINPRHAHQWQWMDQPVINTRLFGPEGMRSEGFRLGWITPLKWPSEIMFGIQNANRDSFTRSFVSGDPVGNRPDVGRDVQDPLDLAYLVRWENSWQNGPAWTSVLGLSGLFGPNDTGPNGRTWIYGLDYRLKWVPQNNFRGYPFFLWQTELMKRDYTADWFIAGTEVSGGGGEGGGICHGGHCHGGGGETDEDDQEYPDDLPADILRDWGGYTQGIWGFRLNWSAGLRLEYANGSGDSVGIDGSLISPQLDTSRGERWRVSPLLTWWPTHFSRLRLQYNYDRAPFLPSAGAHTVWMGMEVVFGAHPAHDY